MPPQVATETNVGEEHVDDDVFPRDGAHELAPEPDDTAAFQRAVPEEFPSPTSEAGTTSSAATDDVVPDEVATPQAEDDAGAWAVEMSDVSRRTVRQRLRARQLRARKVRRTIRHIDPWSVLKFSVFFFALVWMIVIMAGVALWSLAVNSGLITEFEDLVIELFDLTSFSVDANILFRVSVMVGGAMALGGALFMGVLTVLFNLLSDLLGGIRVSVIEEETARRIVE
jgi:hypothetical protein